MKSLVAVTSKEEVKRAVQGGCDILDIKNPSEGSLGASKPGNVKEVFDEVGGRVERSVAIGDVPNLPGTVAFAAKGAAHLKPDYIKVGLKGPDNEEEALEVMEAAVGAVKSVDESISVVSVGYGDYKEAGTVNPLRIPSLAEKSGSEVAILDTALKEGNLLDYLDEEELKEFVQDSHSRGLLTALSGSLGIEHVDTIRKTGADIFGARGAVCSEGRSSELKTSLVEDLVSRVHG